MSQADEGATYRIEDLERKLRLAESTANHIYGRCELLTQHNSKEQNEIGSVNARMTSMSTELQSAFQYKGLPG